ncbi:MAG TPA: peptidoglycan-binding domain-containing protein, partial [Pyrinomonadaceae bacterium]|nr:peptidoglycan-binding domain-containing protein [Pyrinomonadaceae bacterium]
MAVKAKNAIPPKKPSQLQPQSRSESRTRSSAVGPLSEVFSAPAAIRRPATILALQQRVGNRVVQRAIASQGIQREAKQGEDLTSPRFAGDPLLEACFDDRARMTQGHRGRSVEKVQQALLDLGYNLGPSGADGIYGPKTWNAVKQFKANEGLGFENMGDVGPGTMHRLDELFSSKTQESPPKVADEESLTACPSNDVIVTALTAGPRQRNALVGEPTVGQSPSTHVSIADAVSRFKTKLNVTGVSRNNVSETGQFFWVQQMHDAIRTELTLMSSDPTALPFVAKARLAREAIDNQRFAEATQLIRELDVMTQTTKSPSKPKMQSLLRPDLAGAPATET